jgi:hypothetical protein
MNEQEKVKAAIKSLADKLDPADVPQEVVELLGSAGAAAAGTTNNNNHNNNTKPK